MNDWYRRSRGLTLRRIDYTIVRPSPSRIARHPRKSNLISDVSARMPATMDQSVRAAQYLYAMSQPTNAHL